MPFIPWAGINAPRDIAVDREEIAERKRRDRENGTTRAAAASEERRLGRASDESGAQKLRP